MITVQPALHFGKYEELHKFENCFWDTTLQLPTPETLAWCQQPCLILWGRRGWLRLRICDCESNSSQPWNQTLTPATVNCKLAFMTVGTMGVWMMRICRWICGHYTEPSNYSALDCNFFLVSRLIHCLAWDVCNWWFPSMSICCTVLYTRKSISNIFQISLRKN